MNRSKLEQTGREVIFAILLVVLVAFAAVFLQSCTALKSAPGAKPGQMFGDGGKTPCLDAAGHPCVNTPKQWLRPCK